MSKFGKHLIVSAIFHSLVVRGDLQMIDTSQVIMRLEIFNLSTLILLYSSLFVLYTYKSINHPVDLIISKPDEYIVLISLIHSAMMAILIGFLLIIVEG